MNHNKALIQEGKRQRLCVNPFRESFHLLWYIYSPNLFTRAIRTSLGKAISLSAQRKENVQSTGKSAAGNSHDARINAKEKILSCSYTRHTRELLVLTRVTLSSAICLKVCSDFLREFRLASRFQDIKPVWHFLSLVAVSWPCAMVWAFCSRTQQYHACASQEQQTKEGVAIHIKMSRKIWYKV